MTVNRVRDRRIEISTVTGSADASLPRRMSEHNQLNSAMGFLSSPYSSLLISLFSLVLLFFAGNALASSVALKGFHGLEMLALLTVGVGELTALWFFVWMGLALLSTLTSLPLQLRELLATTVGRVGPESARRVAARTVAGAAFVGTTLVAPSAFATQSEDVVDDLLWGSGEDLISEPSVINEPKAIENLENPVWLPGTSPEADVPVQDSPGTETLLVVDDGSVASQTVLPEAPALLEEPVVDAAIPEAIGSAQTEVAKTDSRLMTEAVVPVTPVEQARRAAPNRFSQTRVQEISPRTLMTSRNHDSKLTDVAPSEVVEEVTETPESQDSQPREAHLVVSGDSLWSIAQTNLPAGASNSEIDTYWRKIYDLNIEVIGDNPNHIEPGQLLKLTSAFEFLK